MQENIREEEVRLKKVDSTEELMAGVEKRSSDSRECYAVKESFVFPSWRRYFTCFHFDGNDSAERGVLMRAYRGGDRRSKILTWEEVKGPTLRWEGDLKSRRTGSQRSTDGGGCLLRVGIVCRFSLDHLLSQGTKKQGHLLPDKEKDGEGIRSFQGAGAAAH